MADIKTELENYNIILSILPTYSYNEAITQILKNLQDYKICYVDLNKGTEALLKRFRLNSIDTKNIFFIDGVTLTVNPNAKRDDAILLSSPYALTEMGIAISEVLKASVFDVLIFDSLSTLNVYAKEIKGVSGKFTSNIVNKLRSSKNKGLLTCLENDIGSDLIKQSSLFVDRVLKLDGSSGDTEKFFGISGISLASLGDTINSSNYKTAALVASLLAFSVLALFFTNTTNLTGFVVLEGTSTTPVILPLSILAVIIAIISLLVMHNKKKYKIITVPPNIPERKITKSIKYEFRNKINKWLKGVKALGLF